MEPLAKVSTTTTTLTTTIIITITTIATIATVAVAVTRAWAFYSARKSPVTTGSYDETCRPEYLTDLPWKPDHVREFPSRRQPQLR